MHPRFENLKEGICTYDNKLLNTGEIAKHEKQVLPSQN